MSHQMTIIGTIGAPYGIRGWQWLYSLTENTNSVIQYQPWFIEINNNWQEVKLQSWREHKGDLIIKLEHISDRNQAALITNCKLATYSDSLPKLEEGIYYWKDLIGCRVYNLDEKLLGVVTELMDTGANDVLVIKSADHKEHLIPFLQGKTVTNINLCTKTIVVDWQIDF